MARKMRKFSEGGALGKYNRRMADIEKDFKKDSAGKSGKALEVLEAKRMQRTADAEDDRAKRTGADRTATRAAERAAESNLTKTRKYGAPKAVTTEAPAGKVTDTLGAITAPKSGLSTPAKKPAASKPKPKPSAADTARNKFFQDSLRTSSFKAVGDAANARQKAKIGASDAPSDQGFSRKSKVLGASKDLKTGNKGTGTNRVAAAADPKDKSSAASRARAGAALSYLNPFSYISNNENYTKNQEAKYGKAKGGKIMKYAKGGSTPPQPSAADRARSKKHLDELKKLKPTDAEGKVVGSANRSEGRRYAAGGVTKEMPSSKGMGSLDMAKGGKAKAKPAAKGKGKPFAATKFGAALMKKSADTKGRAMPKFAKGGSIDGCAIKGKTKTSMVKMARGGAAKMRGRDSYGGAEFKKGGKTC